MTIAQARARTKIKLLETHIDYLSCYVAYSYLPSPIQPLR